MGQEQAAGEPIGDGLARPRRRFAHVDAELGKDAVGLVLADLVGDGPLAALGTGLVGDEDRGLRLGKPAGGPAEADEAGPHAGRGSAAGNDEPSEPLGAWRDAVEHGLATAPDLPPVEIDEESAKKLRALGYTG